MRLTLDLPYLKPATATDNAKYRRRVPESHVSVFGKKNVEWSLGTKDPLEIVEQWKIANARFEAMLTRKQDVSEEQIVWEITHTIAVKYGLAAASDTHIGPVDFEQERGLFQKFTEAIREEDAKLTPQQMQAKFANAPALSPVELLLKAQHDGIRKPRVTLEDVRKLYIEFKYHSETNEKEKKNIQRVNRVFEAAYEVLGRSFPLAELGKAEGRKVALGMLAMKTPKGELKKPASVKRELNILKAAVNKAISELGLHGNEALNPFGKLEMPELVEEENEAELRDPLPADILSAARRRIMSHAEPELALIWRILEGTGCRLAEVTGLRTQDLQMVARIPVIRIEAHDLRRLKNKSSRRSVPLIEDALQAAMEARRLSEGEHMLFPAYGTPSGPNNASQALMKHLRHCTNNPKHTVHSLRHNMGVWLDDANVRETTRDRLLGHRIKDVGKRTYTFTPAIAKQCEAALNHALSAKMTWEQEDDLSVSPWGE